MSRLHHQQGGEPSQRMLRVGELIRHTMSELLIRSAISDPVLEGQVVTIPDVRMSPDLKLATIYVMPLGGKKIATPSAALTGTRSFCAAMTVYDMAKAVEKTMQIQNIRLVEKHGGLSGDIVNG